MRIPYELPLPIVTHPYVSLRLDPADTYLLAFRLLDSKCVMVVVFLL
jgi:hypothetical protein